MTGDEVQLAQPESLVQLAAAWGAHDDAWDEDILELEHDGFLVTASATDGRCRVRVSLDLGPVASAEAAEWVATSQPLSPAYLELYLDEEQDGRPHVWAAFERPAAAHDWATDPLLKHAAELRDALAQRREVRVPAGDQVLFGDPVDVVPTSAWLLMGTGAAALTEDEEADMRDEARYGMYEHSWTGAKQTAVGDLLMVYFTAPDKAVRYVGRAASDAFYSSDIAVNADREVAQFQWWVKTTALIEIEPISFSQLTAARDGHLVLRGRSGHFFGPCAVKALPFRAVDPSRQFELEQVVQVPVGLAELPAPAEMSWPEWVSLSPGALPLEQYVSSHLVETLLGFALSGSGLRWVREYRAGRGSADFVVLDGDVPACVIEVKLAAVDSKDLQQLRRYTQELGCRSILMDARRVQLVEAGEVLPWATFERRHMNEDDLAVVRRHLSQR